MSPHHSIDDHQDHADHVALLALRHSLHWCTLERLTHSKIPGVSARGWPKGAACNSLFSASCLVSACISRLGLHLGLPLSWRVARLASRLVLRLGFYLSACISACLSRRASRVSSLSASLRANGPGFLRTHQLVIGGLHGVLFAVDHWTRVLRTLNSSDPSVRRGGHYSAWLRQR